MVEKLHITFLGWWYLYLEHQKYEIEYYRKSVNIFGQKNKQQGFFSFFLSKRRDMR